MTGAVSLGLGIGISELGLIESAPAGGGPAPYHADAVHFDGNTFLSIASLAATNNSRFSISGWIKLAAADLGNGWSLLANDTQNNDGIFDFRSDIIVECKFVSPSAGASTVIVSNEVTSEVWVNFIFSVDNSAQQAALYINDTAITFSATNFPSPAVNFLYNGLDCFFGSDGYGDNGIADFADCRAQIGTSWLDGGGLIPEATRRLFIDAGGKPVDPATATGTLGAPTILFSGDATGFGTNQGTGGTFTTTGTLTNASTSPSD